MAMTMISYAQTCEDVLLNRVFAGRADGFYLDVGANDPVLNSVTKHFSNLGWRGINIEPEAETCRRVAADRPRDINLNVGISDREGTLTFYDATASQGWSTFSRAQAEWHALRGIKFVETLVPVTTLARVCAEHVDRTIDFLKIDAESHEREVILGADWSAWRPRVVLVEATDVDGWEPTLLAGDYLFAAFDGLNRYYVRAEDRGLLPAFAAPVNSLDDSVPFAHHLELEALRASYREYDDLGPLVLDVARRLKRMAGRHPRLAAAVRRFARKVG